MSASGRLGFVSLLFMAVLPARASEQDYAKLTEQEGVLAAAMAELKADGYDAPSLESYLMRSERGESYQRQWLARQVAFQQKIDEFILAQQRYFIEVGHRRQQELVMQIGQEQRLSPAQSRALHSLELAEAEYQTYIDRLSLYGQSKDYQRINAFAGFFRNYRAAVGEIQGVGRPERPYAKKFRHEMMKMALKNPMTFSEVFLPRGRRSKTAPHTDLATKSTKLVQKLYRKLHAPVRIAGTENLPPQFTEQIPDTRVVNVFACMHRNPFFDEVLKAHLDLPHFMVVWAVGTAGMPSFLRSRFEHANTVIPVGRGFNSVDLAIAKIKKRYSNNIMIHPQGAVATFNEVMPVHENFSAKFLKTLVDQGYTVNLVPVSNMHAPVFIKSHYYDGMEDDGMVKPIDGRVHKSLPPRVLAELVGSEAGQAIVNHYMRAIWLEDMPLNGEQIMGQLRMQVVASRMLKEFGPLWDAEPVFGVMTAS